MTRATGFLCVLAAALPSCGGYLDDSDSGLSTAYDGESPNRAGGSDDSEGADGSDGSSGTDGTFDDGHGSEDEASERVLRPAATPDHVFIANADRDTVTRVSLPSLAVVTSPVGSRPGAIVPTPDGQTAVVLNVGSHDLTLLDARSMDRSQVEIRPHLNTLAVDPSGDWAVAWFSDAAADDADPTAAGAQSYNEISFVHLATEAHHPMVVGFNPHGVQFTPDGDLAVIVSDAWLALVDLTGDTPVTTRVRIADDTVNPPAAEELLITPDGRYAFVRQYAVGELKLVDLQDATVTEIPVGGNPTDLDITPDGTTAIAVARSAGELWLYDTSDPTATPTVVPMPSEEIFGSLAMSEDGTQAILYTTAVARPRYGTWTVGETGDDAVVVRSLVKPIHSLVLSADGATAAIIHDEDPDGSTTDGPFRYSWALTMVDLSTHFANPLLLAAEPAEFTSTGDGRYGAFIMEGQPYLEVLDYHTLLYEEVELRSDPSHMGLFPGTRLLWVSQEHELGRVSFYDIDDADLQTITGFELNSGIE